VTPLHAAREGRGLGGGGGELNHFSESAMGWLAVFLAIFGLLSAIFGLLLVTGERDYVKFKPDMPNSPAKRALFAASVKGQRISRIVQLVVGSILLVDAVALWIFAR
jgi:hypothetical protein